jgi:hypothetical protein
MSAANNGLMVAAAGAGIQAIDYVTAQGPPGTVSPGGVFYGPGGILASFPKAGFYLIVGGLAWWLWNRR